MDTREEVRQAVEAALLNSECSPAAAVVEALRAVDKFAASELDAWDSMLRDVIDIIREVDDVDGDDEEEEYSDDSEDEED